MASYVRVFYAFLTLNAVVELEMLTIDAQETSANVECNLTTAQIDADYVNGLLGMEDNLIKFQLSVENQTLNPLQYGNTRSYNTDVWFRASSITQRRMLNTVFSFTGSIPPIVALSYVYDEVKVNLREHPLGCLAGLTESQKVDAVQSLIMNDLRASNASAPVHSGPVWVCHQVVEEGESGYAKFRIRCCRQGADGELDCKTEVAEGWLRLLIILLLFVYIIAILVGPLFIPKFLYSVTEESTKYVVHFKEPYHLRIAIRSVGGPYDGLRSRHILDLRQHWTWDVCRRQVMRLPRGVDIPIVIRQYKINVSKRRLIGEGCVPVTLFKYIRDSVFFCKLRRSAHMLSFCQQYAYGGSEALGIRRATWKEVCNVFGRSLMVLLLPLPFYIRMMFYIQYEHPELRSRIEVAENLNLRIVPLHPPRFFITMGYVGIGMAYAIYVVGGLRLAALHAHSASSRYQQPLSESFDKLKRMQILHFIGESVKKLLWPLGRFGVFPGCIVGLCIWPIAVPVIAILTVVYGIPLVYLSVQFTKNVIQSVMIDTHGNEFQDRFPPAAFVLSLWFDVFSILMFIYAVMLMFSMVVGFLFEVACLVIMGMAVDALKYISVVCLLYIYSVDCFGEVRDKYMHLNRQLHEDIKSRIGSDLDDFVSLPQSMREHRAFKASEASEQGPHEKADEIILKHGLQCWSVNDLVLFVDEYDRPRIPRCLFDDICDVQLPGSPGPPARSLARATCKFSMIVLFLSFVFSIVFAFGDSYHVSSVRQLLATLAGGFLPIVFRKVLLILSPKVMPITVSFRCRIEEVIRNFRQEWPLADLPFEVDLEAVRREGYTKSTPVANANLVDLLILVPSPEASPLLELEIVD